MNDRILESILQIEKEENVRILYACESGSRAWGFASADSDYDVRFIYVRPREWYLSIYLEHKRDVIEKPITDLLDINGWDLRKALRLFRKSNPPLMEWLISPIVYHAYSSISDQMREMARRYYSPRNSIFHYSHMARGNYREYLTGQRVWIKKYFYVLRPLLAIRWIESGRGIVPMEFEVLVNRLLPDAALKSEIKQLLEAKRAGEELDYAPPMPAISEYVKEEIERSKTIVMPPNSPPPAEELDDLFRRALEVAW